MKSSLLGKTKVRWILLGLSLSTMTVMGTASAEVEYTSTGTITREGDNVTLHNVGIVDGPVGHANGFLYNFDEPDKNLTIQWDGDMYGETPIRNASPVNAKNLTLISSYTTGDTPKDQYANKGIFADKRGNNPAGEVHINVSEDINITTGHFPIFADPGSIYITGFQNLNATTTGLIEGAGYVVRNASEGGNDSIIQIVGQDDSTINLISQKSSRMTKQTAVVEDGSPLGTLISGGTININRINKEDHSIVMTGHSWKEGHIDIEGNQAVTIGSASDDYAVQAHSESDGASTIDINKTAGGVVTINGKVTADGGTLNINYAGTGSLQNGDAEASTYAQNPGVLNLNFSGENSGMVGNLSASDDSTATVSLASTDTYLTGDVSTSDDSTATVSLTGSSASLTGDVTTSDSSTATVSLTGSNASLTGNVTTNDDSTATVSLTGSNTSLTGDMVTTGTSTLTVEATGSNAVITGDLDNEGGTANVTLSNQSLWTGTAETADSDTAVTNVTLEDNSVWNVTADSTVSTLTLSSGGVVNMEGSASTLRIGHLTSSESLSGTLRMDLTYHDNSVSTYENAADSDFIYVNSGTGHSFQIEPTSSSNLNSMQEGDKLYFAQTGTGASAFEVNQQILLRNTNRLYNKELVVKNESDPSLANYEDWFLTADTSGGAEDGDVLNPNGLAPGSAHNAAVAMWRDQDTLLKRLGELRYNRDDEGIWTRFINKKLEYGGNRGFETNLKTVQVGYDWKNSGKDSDWYYGGAFEHTWGSSDFGDNGTGDHHLSDVAIYGTNIGKHGHYLDLIAKFGKISSDYKSSYSDEGEFDNWAFSIGAEYGRKKELGSGWYIEPQAQLTYSYIWGDDYTTKNGARIKQDDTDSLIGRLGFIVSKEYDTDTNRAKRVYAKASVHHEFLGDRSERLYDDVAFRDSDDFGDTWYSVGIGTNIRISDNGAFYFDAERDFGADVKSKYRLEGGLRFEF
jgi:outer membrane autotransporter protein